MRSDFIFLFLMKRNRTFNLNINRKDSDTTDELKIIHTNIFIQELQLTT